MGYLFENMEKVDIQAERRKAKAAQKKRVTAEKKAKNAKRKAEEAEKKAADAEQKAADFEQKASDAEQKAADFEQKASDAEQKAADFEQKAVEAVISICRELNGTEELAVLKLQTQYGLTLSSAREKVSAYWNS